MRRLVLAAAIALSVTPTAGGAVPPGHAGLRAFACRAALDPAQRVVSVTAVMGALPGTKRLLMRFALYSRSSGTMWPVLGGDLGKWISPQPATLGTQPKDVWVVRHPVTALPVPGSYRFRVTFRWIGPGGATLAQTVRSSQTCRQPDLRPDLFVQSIAVQPIAGDPASDRYVVTIGNDGLTLATGVQVLFAPGGSALTQSDTILRVPSHETRQVSFVGPACASATAPTVTVDPQSQIGDLNRANNSMTATCPG